MRAPARLAGVSLAVGGLLLGALAPSAPVAASEVASEITSEILGGPQLASRGVVTNPAPGVAPPPVVASAAYVVADADTGAILAAKAAHVRLPPASTLKALTALTLLPRLDRRAVYTATQADANVEGSKAGVVPRGRYTVDQLWQAVFLRSGNDAVNCLATLNGGVPATLRQMREKAAALGARNTTVANATGLDAPGQLSSAYDLALIGRAAFATPEVLAYSSKIQAPFPGKVVPAGKRRPTFQLWTQQRFVLGYDGAVGIKNGFTTKARYTLIAASTRGNRSVLVTVMRSPRNGWRDAAALSDWAYRYGSRVQPVGHLVEPAAAAAVPAGGPAAGPATSAVPAKVAAAGPAAGSGPVRWLGMLFVVLVATAAALRTRVLLRARRRARR